MVLLCTHTTLTVKVLGYRLVLLLFRSLTNNKAELEVTMDGLHQSYTDGWLVGYY